VIKEIGDAVMASFDDCVLSVKAAIKNAAGDYAYSQLSRSMTVCLFASVDYGPGIVRQDDVSVT